MIRVAIRSRKGVTVVLPRDPTQHPLPGPISTASHERGLPGFRGWPVRKQVVVGAACFVSAFLVLLTPWEPTLGLLGLIALASVILLTDALDLQSRVPILRSDRPLVAAAGWAVISALLLVAAIFVLVRPSSFLPSRERSATNLFAPPAVPVRPSALTSPQPLTIPATAPPATPPPAVAFLEAPLAAARGQTVTLGALTAPNTECSIDVGYPSGPQLESVRSDAAGNVSWTWRVGKRVPAGSWPITVSCRSGTASTQIVVSSASGD